MSKKKKQNHFKEVHAKREAAIKKQQEAAKKDDTQITITPGKPQMVPYDATKHKGYVLMYKKNSPNSTMWIRGKEVKAFRAAGWKTDAEVRKIYAKWLRKHPEEAAKMKEEMEQNLKGINCPLCNGSTKIWVQCCLPGTEDGCGCNHLPVMNDCYICQGTGKADPQVAELLVSDYLVGLRNEQVELDEFMRSKDTPAPPGLLPGEACNREGCLGEIYAIDDFCSCHINPPCKYCVEGKYACDICDWRGTEE